MPLGTDTKQYETPNHPYQGERIANEHSLIDRYGLKNKEELWRAQSQLRSYRREARELLGQPQGDATVQRRSEEFLGRLKRVGILDETDELGDVLGLEVEDVLERRLQTVVYRKGLANTTEQARQFITHGHVVVGSQRHQVPSYVVDVDEENLVEFDESSPLADELHPERAEGQ
ncbi:30S ribosomal protein S4 [Natronobacterium gregoryi]|uniref:Small ribosomal subunit protein uS4 n=2 Tax=Natronobacterium gregoryi TaxID=44930 RepID=L0AIJ3_NATGS|nr:30S ribosomal protein S4 [Natronobacterium gregoryi]AFZ73708.1 ribosomal protein S4/S9 [Natronobacterium gregoryi SP2]ELY67668.1 30S ribosomal protein S4P [Natronobacterium gregoryi SP2]PLK19576.1 30S ribosomal protein S4 [Natronobacterium gregoryi SP2]SFJ01685.1 SSU ribosomal protein S4P [Natronobacterium gregoryi]